LNIIPNFLNERAHFLPRDRNASRRLRSCDRETGPDPVFARAAADRATRFVRVMILPRELLGKSSIEYLNEEDKAKPKSQTYKISADLPIAMK
jgi:hypothetical protein